MTKDNLCYTYTDYVYLVQFDHIKYLLLNLMFEIATVKTMQNITNN